MASSSLWLPAPSQALTSTTKITPQSNTSITDSPKILNAPSYEERCNSASQWSRMDPSERKTKSSPFVPRSISDFDDGGSFPEIHIAQYPRHIGNPHLAKRRSELLNDKENDKEKKSNRSAITPAGLIQSSTSVLNVEVNGDGSISYDAIVKSGTNSDKLVYTTHSAIKGGEPSPADISLPSSTEIQSVTDKTSAALQSLVSHKSAWAKPTGSAMIQAATSKNVELNTQFIKYKPREDAPGYNPATSTRVIQMVPAQIDPMMPPRHQHKKAPRGPAEDPVPVLHAPPKKLTKEERDAWQIPACISNWKNTRGYTIPLDKRLAADGRGLRDHSINSNFATLSESLYVAERQAREEVRMRSEVQKRLIVSEKERREQDLRDLANKARMERSGNPTQQTPAQINPSLKPPNQSIDIPTDIHLRRRKLDQEQQNPPAVSSEDESQSETMHDKKRREELRIARKRERERELRLDNLKGEAKKSKLEQERDVSEKIALGVNTGTGGGLGGEVDSRLYNQSAGLSSGFGAEDEYNTYNKPLFDRDATAKAIYRPSRDANTMDPDQQFDNLVDGAANKFKPDKGFAGADGSGGSDGPRKNPVQFERGK